MIKDHKYQSKN